MDPLTSEFWIMIGVSILCGGIVGFERQMRGKPAGIRTNILICLGTTIFIQLSTLYTGQNTDMTRVLGQVVTGIGFLGAGVILARGRRVQGVTSAAVIWTLAGIGSMIGFGHFAAAIALSIVTVGILTVIEYLELNLRWFRHEERPHRDEFTSREQ